MPSAIGIPPMCANGSTLPSKGQWPALKAAKRTNSVAPSASAVTPRVLCHLMFVIMALTFDQLLCMLN